MRTLDIKKAKKDLFRLVEMAAKGESFVIARYGKPLVKVTALDAPCSGVYQRTGFLKGKITVPDDFDTMGRNEIVMAFGYPEGFVL